ncbi:hypothetical protein L6452_28866 [Arctium lappa]|uniref:Uncharacterized protein n=1 Tax=Arctium lappa TaxID=4217 RepID=A0ACB9A043_ARCLA|nr:hypothetical protein L6452_28866 [Arctium lappa]
MENQYQTHMTHRHQLSAKTMLFATVAGITIGGPLLAMTAFSFLATMALFLVTSPLLIIFSPLLIGATFVLLAALGGFGAAAVMAIAGLSALRWVLRSDKGDEFKDVNLTQKLVDSGEKLKEKVVESGENMMDTGKDWVNHLKQPVENSSENITTGKDWASHVENSPENKTTDRDFENVKSTGKNRGGRLNQTVENSPENKRVDIA